MTILDLTVILVVLLSTALAMIRGFVREMLTIVAWFAAAVAAYVSYKPLAVSVAPYAGSGTAPAIVAIGAVFIVALVLASYVTTKIGNRATGRRVGAADRALGFLFGAVRGVLLLVVALLVFDWLITPSPAWLATAQTRPVLEILGTRLVAALPKKVTPTSQTPRVGGDVTAHAPAPAVSDTATIDAPIGTAAPPLADQPPDTVQP